MLSKGSSGLVSPTLLEGKLSPLRSQSLGELLLFQVQLTFPLGEFRLQGRDTHSHVSRDCDTAFHMSGRRVSRVSHALTFKAAEVSLSCSSWAWACSSWALRESRAWLWAPLLRLASCSSLSFSLCELEIWSLNFSTFLSPSANCVRNTCKNSVRGKYRVD